MYRPVAFLRPFRPAMANAPIIYRSLSTTPRLSTLKDTAERVNKTVGQKLASGLGKAQHALGQDLDDPNAPKASEPKSMFEDAAKQKRERKREKRSEREREEPRIDEL